MEKRGARPYIALPFDPGEAWGARDRYHLNGQVAGTPVRGPLSKLDDRWVFLMPVGWLTDGTLQEGARVSALLAPEGPQLAAVDADILEALDAEPRATAFFEGLPTFYRKGYLRWLDGAARRPAVRRERIVEFIQHLMAERKERPR